MASDHPHKNYQDIWYKHSSGSEKNQDHLSRIPYNLLKLYKEKTIRRADLLVTFNIVSLFSIIVVPEVIKTIEKNHPLQHILHLIITCLNNKFHLQQPANWQVTAAPVGSPLSPVVADLFTESFEEKALILCFKTLPMVQIHWWYLHHLAI